MTDKWVKERHDSVRIIWRNKADPTISIEASSNHYGRLVVWTIQPQKLHHSFDAYYLEAGSRQQAIIAIAHFKRQYERTGHFFRARWIDATNKKLEDFGSPLTQTYGV